MSPEAVNYMTIAEAAYERAVRSFDAKIYENAARDSYTAVLNAARAVIFDKTTTAPKTHSGTRSKFFELVHEGMPFDAELAQFLREGFETKQGIDYGPEVVSVSREQAEEYLNRAVAFIAAAKAVCA
ncbi:MAG TPA: HEPN domain-containing protein [Steroidobacteraceae bacterium]|nr:HEPN domain-containing protein [Steroidobacteraceae bacterium]